MPEFSGRKHPAAVLSAFLLCACFFPPQAQAIVGQAESFDEFEAEMLSDFQSKLIQEEQTVQPPSERVLELLKQKQELGASDPKLKDAQKELDEEMELLKMQLLSLPKRKKFRLEMYGAYKYTSNRDRKQLRRGQGDSIFDARKGLNIDLSGQKTDFRFVSTAGKRWHWKRSETDATAVTQSLNYRRKYYKKILHSLQNRLNRFTEKTIEINSEKVRWDFGSTSSYNYPVTPKLSTNLTLDADKRLFPQEAFDEDSYWEVGSAPSLFWNVTPKSRLSLGYKFAANRIRSKDGDANAHEVHWGYFGRVTRKSSTSLDLSVGRQNPRSLETARTKTLNMGWGYIWQWTPKTQLTVQMIRSLQNSTSNLVSGEVDGVNETSKEETHFTNDSLSFSMNSRLARKLTAGLTLNISHLRTSVEKTGRRSSLTELEENKTRQITFPVSLNLTYYFLPNAQWTVGYGFVYRRADEKPDTFRAHELNTNMRIAI